MLWSQSGDLMQLLNQYQVFIQDTLWERWTFCGFLQHTAFKFFLCQKAWCEMNWEPGHQWCKKKGTSSAQLYTSITKEKASSPLFYTFQNIPNFWGLSLKVFNPQENPFAWRKSMIQPFLSQLWTMKDCILLVVFQTWYIIVSKRW